jgi:hypothetical protein
MKHLVHLLQTLAIRLRHQEPRKHKRETAEDAEEGVGAEACVLD